VTSKFHYGLLKNCKKVLNKQIRVSDRSRVLILLPLPSATPSFLILHFSSLSPPFFFLMKPTTLFAWLISHQPTVLFSQNKPATSNQPALLFSQNKPASAISHQPTEQAVQFCIVSSWYYRCPDGPDTMGGTMHDTTKHGTNTTQHDGRSVSADTTRWWAVSGPRSRHAVSTRTRHEK
jgi:hypothetical protein